MSEDRKYWLWRRFAMCLSAFLMFTASMKLYGLMVDPYKTPGVYPALFVIAAQAELVLAFWLLSGWRARACRVACVGLFMLFAIVSYGLAINGQASCGCLGLVPVSPWWTLGINLLAILLLIVNRPVEGRWRNYEVVTSGVYASFALSIPLLVLFCFVPNPVSTLDYAFGRGVSIEPACLDAGSHNIGETKEYEVSVINRSSQPVKILGSSSPCSCFSTLSLPITVAANSKEKIKILVKFVGSNGVFGKSYALYTTSNVPMVSGRISGKVLSE